MALVGKELGANEGTGRHFPIPRPFLDGLLFRERNAQFDIVFDRVSDMGHHAGILAGIILLFYGPKRDG